MRNEIGLIVEGSSQGRGELPSSLPCFIQEKPRVDPVEFLISGFSCLSCRQHHLNGGWQNKPEASSTREHWRARLWKCCLLGTTFKNKRESSIGFGFTHSCYQWQKRTYYTFESESFVQNQKQVCLCHIATGKYVRSNARTRHVDTPAAVQQWSTEASYMRSYYVNSYFSRKVKNRSKLLCQRASFLSKLDSVDFKPKLQLRTYL